MSTSNYKQCNFCVMDTSDPDIQIFTDGCMYCKRYKTLIPSLPKFQPNANELLQGLVAKIKKHGKNRQYDCLIGVSGGVDSSYVAYYVKQVLGLRPLALHMDNGWNDELAVHNIERILRKLDIDLWTEVLDWDEFKSLQLAFLKANVPDCEIPTDHAIVAALYNTAKRFNIKYILVGNNLVTESIMPHAWSQGHADWMYISSINSKYGSRNLKTFPHMTYLQQMWRKYFPSIEKERLLSYIDFDKAAATKLLQEQFGWQPYSGKHHESVYTKFYQAYWLPTKFGYDKRKGHLSALICAGQITREQALLELQIPPISSFDIAILKDFVSAKLGVSIQELDEMMVMQNQRFHDFASYQNCWQYFALRKIYRLSFKPLLKMVMAK